ncbi:MAG: glycosyltransferase family 2 protein [bacterium]|nr:glycosyltransferase family 2 protein [bacterium]
MNSLIIPVYGNEGSIPDLLEALEQIDEALEGSLEVVFVVDGSPDRSAARLHEALPGCGFTAQLVELSRNFGSFAAIRAGLREATGTRFAVMAADLQEPPSLIIDFFLTLTREPVDVVVGTREGRDDPMLSAVSSRLFWFAYRKLVQKEMPEGGVDIFGCNRAVRDRLLELDESNSTLVGLLFWVGFQRKSIPYRRLARADQGKSGWTFAKKLRYLTDSVYAFSDLPIRLLLLGGGAGLAISLVFVAVVVGARLSGTIEVPGYAATVLTVVFFAALNMLGLGIIGSYVWRAFENTKRRPGAIIMAHTRFDRAKPQPSEKAR